jgi:hypothetical protein
MPLPYPRNFEVCFVFEGERSSVVVSHISRKTSEMWGTQAPWSGQVLLEMRAGKNKAL